MPLRRLAEWWKARSRGRDREAPGAPTPSGVSSSTRPERSSPAHDGNVPKHLGELWDVLQGIAQEEDSSFADKPVMQHAAESVEGKKDVDRWLQVYLRRTNPEHDFQFPDHHPRHRGYCLIPRHWPNGTTWDAFDEETFLKAPVECQRSREALITELDRLLETRVDG